MMLLGHAQVRLPQLSLRGIWPHPQRGVEIAAASRAAAEHGAGAFFRSARRCTAEAKVGEWKEIGNDNDRYLYMILNMII